MPTFLNVKNNASSILASNITAGATSLTVAAGEGARFPTSNFHITIEDEILLCSSRTTDTFTVVRAKEDTVAATHTAGKAVRLNITAAIIEELKKQLWDADGDTGIQVEESADEDKIRMDVAGVEAFVLDNGGILTLAKQSGIYVRQTADQSIPNTTETKVNLATTAGDVVFDIQNEWSTANKKFTAKIAGLYLIVGLAYYSAATVVANKYYSPRVFKNGAMTPLFAASHSALAYSFGVFFSGIAVLAVNDYIELYEYHDSGAAATLSASWTSMAIVKLA